jgi:ubiquitin-like 1-activating enzyme E1 B
VPLDFETLVPDLPSMPVHSPEQDQAAWSVAESAAAFVGAVVRAFETRGLRAGQLAFDKDDAECIDFVTAASNLRSAVFGIPLQSRFIVKEIAGNIIPAIATTNAIIAGYIAVEALKVLKAGGSVRDCSSVFLCRALSGKRKDRLLVSSKLHPPNAYCFVCGTASVTVELDLGSATAMLLVQEVLRTKLSFHEPNLRDGEPRAHTARRRARAPPAQTDAPSPSTPPARSPSHRSALAAARTGDRVLYECGDLDEEEAAAEEAKLGKLLTDPPFNLRNGAMLHVDDQSQSLTCQLIVSHNAELDLEQHPLGFVVKGAAAAASQPPPNPAANGRAGVGPSSAAVGVDDDFEIVEGPPPASSTTAANGKKRARAH